MRLFSRVHVRRPSWEVNINCTYVGQLASLTMVCIGLMLVIGNESTTNFIVGCFLLLTGCLLAYAAFYDKIKDKMAAKGDT